jgi:hypothetical protein
VERTKTCELTRVTFAQKLGFGIITVHWNSFNFQISDSGIFPAAAPTLAEFLNWMPSTEPPDDGAAEDIQESAEAALAATSQGI